MTVWFRSLVMAGTALLCVTDVVATEQKPILDLSPQNRAVMERPANGADLWMPTPSVNHLLPAPLPRWELEAGILSTRSEAMDRMMPWPEHPRAVSADNSFCKSPPEPGWKVWMRDRQAWARGDVAQSLPGRQRLEPYTCDGP